MHSACAIPTRVTPAVQAPAAQRAPAAEAEHQTQGVALWMPDYAKRDFYTMRIISKRSLEA